MFLILVINTLDVFHNARNGLRDKSYIELSENDVKTFDKMAQKLNECKIDKNAYYKMTVNKYQNVVELIQKKRKANEDYLFTVIL